MGRCCEGPPDDLVRLMVDGKTIAIAHIGRIVEEVRVMGLEDETQISDELIRLVKVFNYVPSVKEMQYRQAIFAYYKEVRVK